MNKRLLERGYRKAEEKEAKRRSKDRFEEGLMSAKEKLISILGPAAGQGIRKLSKLETIIKKIESLQND